MAAMSEEMDEGIDDAVSRDVAAIKERVSKEGNALEQALEEDEASPLVSTAPDPEPEDLDDEPKRVPRKVARQNRYREQMERAEAAERRAQEAEERLRRMEEQRHEYVPEPPAPEQKENARLKELYQQQDMMLQNFSARAKTLTPEQVEDYKRQSRQIDEQIQRERFKEWQQDSAPSQQSPQQQAMAYMAMKYSDVYGRKEMLSAANAHYDEQVFKGRQESLELLEESLQEARSKFGVGRKPPTERERSRYTGGRTTRGNVTEPRDERIKMIPEFRVLADNLYPHIEDPNERYNKWAQGPGRRLMEQEKKKRRG